MVLGVIGTVGVDGVLQVDSWHAPVPAPASNTASTTSTATTTSTAAPHLLLVSGLQCGGAEVSSLPREMLLSYLEGRTPAHSAATVCRVIIAGASVGTSTSSSSSSISSSSTSSDNDSKAAAVKELDGFLVQLAGAGVPVDILPGANDPTTANWPQRPLHRSLFQQTARFLSSLVSRTPNPYAAAHDGQYVLGTDGANVQDLTRHLLTTTTTSTTTTETSDKTPQVPVTELQALQRTLQVGHICPTGPDSVPTIPHPREDPMVITTQPGIYFAGNCSKFDTSLVATNQSSGTDQEATTMNSSSSRSRLVCLPKFCDTGEVVLVNLETLGVEILQFQE
jgi:DNA polymerase delta subunit 2